MFVLLSCCGIISNLHSFPTRRSSDLLVPEILAAWDQTGETLARSDFDKFKRLGPAIRQKVPDEQRMVNSYLAWADRKSTRLNSSHPSISYAVFCLKKKKLFLICQHR